MHISFSSAQCMLLDMIRRRPELCSLGDDQNTEKSEDKGCMKHRRIIASDVNVVLVKVDLLIAMSF